VTAAYLAPYLTQRFVDNNGNPLINGTVSTYAGGTTTPIATYVDSTGTTQNTNPITLNFRGECQIWLLPNVSYKFVVQDSLGNLITTVDNVVNAALISLYGGVDTGVANAYILSFASPVPPNTNGQVVFFLPANSNTGPSTINVNGGGVQPILNPNGTPLGANQILANQFASIIELNGVWQLYGGSGVGVNVGTFGAEFVIAAAATTDLGSASGHNVNITGSASITSFGSSAQVIAPIYIGRFTGVNTLVNSSALILPGGLNITTQNGDTFIAEVMTTGNWRVLSYTPIQPDFGFAKVKAADTPVTSSTTLTQDPALLSNPLAIGQYELEIYLVFDSATAAAGFKWELSGSATDSRGTIPVIGVGFVNGAFFSGNATPYAAAVTYSTVSNTSNSNQVLYKGTMLVSTAGTVGIQWAQGTSNGSATTLRAGSYIRATPVGNSANAAAVTHLYTTAGTFTETIPAGVSTCVIEVFGAGGGGGAKFASGGNTSGGGGGGSGGYSRTSVAVGGSAGLTMGVTVGAGANGLNGGPSFVQSGSFSLTTLTGNGGILGGSAPSLATGGTGGAGGTASGGTAVNTSGNAGSAGANNAGGGTGGAGGPGVSGINAGGNPGGNGGGVLANQPGGTGVVIFSYS
jgi:hypothetical protein